MHIFNNYYVIIVMLCNYYVILFLEETRAVLFLIFLSMYLFRSTSYTRRRKRNYTSYFISPRFFQYRILIEVFSNDLSIIEGFCSKIVNRKITIDRFVSFIGKRILFGNYFFDIFIIREKLDFVENFFC